MKGCFIIVLALCLILPAFAQNSSESDIINVSGGTLEITFIGHGTLMLEYKGLVIHVDPVSREADYSQLPTADLILITHNHADHLDKNAVSKIKNENTIVILSKTSADQLGEGIVMKNGDIKSVLDLKIESVPAYNTTPARSRFHPKGRDNGYILTIGGKRIYIAGDTEDTPEMKALGDIDVAFLPMNQPYTMTPEQAAGAAKAFRPKILYPYHYGNTNLSRLTELLKNEAGIEVRIR